MSILSLLVSEKAYAIPYDFSRVATLTGLATLAYVASTLIIARSLALQVSLKLICLAALPMVLYLTGFFHENEVETSKIFVQRFLNRYRLRIVTEPRS